jgi:hypothetical protein
MPMPDDLVAIIERFQRDEQTGEDVTTIQQILNQLGSNHDPSAQNQGVQQIGKYNIFSEEAKNFQQIGDRIGFDAEDVASLLIQVVQTFQASQALTHPVQATQSEGFWKNLTFDEQSATSFVEQINSRLTKLEEIHEVTQLSEQQRTEFNTLKSKARDIRDIERRLEDIAEDSGQLLQRAIQELAAKLKELSTSQQNHLIKTSTQICVQEQLDVFTQFQLELEQGLEVADWLDRRIASLTQTIGQQALNAYPKIRDAATAKQTKIFYLTIEQFIERLIQCLESGNNDYLEMPKTPIVLDDKIYEAAFENLKNLLPERLPKKGIDQLEEYINFLLGSLPTYQHLSFD